MKHGGVGPREVARYLRQQGELGGGEFYLGELDREGVGALLSALGEKSARGPERLPESRASTPSTSELPPPPPSSDYEALRQEALGCRRCGLAGTRTQVVFSDGTPRARVMVVGEAPGAQEDKTGRAFVGPAGKFLDLLLASVGLDREESVYICNVLKCRPPGNRNPLPGEIEACTPHLKGQIRLIAPEAILAVGLFSGQFLSNREASLAKLRGEVYSYEGVPLVVTYHPAALLRNPGLVRPTWEDLQLLRQVMDGV